MVNRVAVLGVDEDLLGVVGARLELGDVLEAVDLVPRPRRDAANAREVFLGVGAVLRELIAAAERTLDRRWRVHCKQPAQRSEEGGEAKVRSEVPRAVGETQWSSSEEQLSSTLPTAKTAAAPQRERDSWTKTL